MDNRPIGVFDSGFGGLTVLKEIMKMMPNESIAYFGDNGRAPYGTKSRETVTKFTFQNINFLLSQDIKMIVIACNTASAYSYNMARDFFDVPVVEVIQPGALTAVRSTKNKRVGVIGTTATISSGAYEKAIKCLDSNIKVFSKACPLFVSLVEEGWCENEIAEMVAREYLKELKQMDIDTLVLGCTHYPLLSKTISKVMGENVELVSSAREAASVVKDIIIEKDIQRDSRIKPVYRYYTSDNVQKFKALGSTFLIKELDAVEKVDIEKYPGDEC